MLFETLTVNPMTPVHKICVSNVAQTLYSYVSITKKGNYTNLSLGRCTLTLK